MARPRSSLSLGVLCCVLALGCSSSSGGPAPCDDDARCGAVDPTLAGQLLELQGVAIYFGHNSVGTNMMDGLAGLLAEQPGGKPALVDTSTAGNVARGVFAHSGIGGNGDPDAKIAAFRARLTGDLGDEADLAFFKFCYVDFETDTWDRDASVDGLFAGYQAMVAAVHAAHPDLKLVHVTVPLSPSNDVNNARRERISQKLRDAYGADVFDLAAIEAGGGHFSGSYGLYLNPAWAADSSGHLNATGSRAVALELVAFLAGRI